MGLGRRSETKRVNETAQPCVPPEDDAEHEGRPRTTCTIGVSHPFLFSGGETQTRKTRATKEPQPASVRAGERNPSRMEGLGVGLVARGFHWAYGRPFLLQNWRKITRRRASWIRSANETGQLREARCLSKRLFIGSA